MSGHNRNSTSPEQDLGSLDQREAKAREHLAAGKFRKARDLFKELCRTDREKYLPGLIEANIGLARDMLAKGMISEAEQVVAYLHKLATPEALKPLEDELAKAKAREAAARQPAAPPPTSPTEVAADIRALLNEQWKELPDADQSRLADHCVVSFQPAPEGASPKLAAELEAIHAALRALSENQLDQVHEHLRQVAHQSPFRHWKLLLKGLVAFYGEDFDRAEKCFERLPADSVPARAAEPYRVLIQARNQRPFTLNEATFSRLCQVAGYPKLANPLLAAQRDWVGRNHSKAYLKLRWHFAQHFPSVQPDVWGELSRYVFNHALDLNNPESFDFVDALQKCLNGRKKLDLIAATETMWFKRTLAKLRCKFLSPPDAETDWDQALKLMSKVYGRSQSRTAMGYAWLAEEAAHWEPESDFPFGYLFLRKSMEGPRVALRLLKKAHDLDPDNVDIALQLCRAYERCGQQSERNRLLDVMTQRFPDRKEVLFMAGVECVKRRAFSKGLTYLRAAREADRIDPAIGRVLIRTLLLRLKELYRKKNKQAPQRIAELWAEIDRERVDQPHDYTRSHWCLDVWRGRLEGFYGDEQQAMTCQMRAAHRAPSAEALAYYDYFVTRQCEPKQGRVVPVFLPTDQASLARIPALCRIWKHFRDEWGIKTVHRDFAPIQHYVEFAVERDFTRQEAIEAAEALLDTGYERPVWEVLDTVLEQDPNDPFFRCLEIQQNWFYNHMPFAPMPDVIGELDEIIEEAKRRGDTKALDQAIKLRRQAERTCGADARARREEAEAYDEGYEDEDDDYVSESDVLDVQQELVDTLQEVQNILASPPSEFMMDFEKLGLEEKAHWRVVAAQLAGTGLAGLARFRMTDGRDLPYSIFAAIVHMALERKRRRRPAPDSQAEGQLDFF